MGRVYDTSANIDTSMMYKTKLSKNFFGDNYWIESMQNKIDHSWQYAVDVVDVDEQKLIRNNEGYTQACPEYNQIEVRINSAYDEKGQKLGDDYKDLIFKDIKHPLELGRKYHFDIQDFTQQDEKYKSTWLAINFNTTQLTPNLIARRCTGNLGFLINGRTQEWYEPAILDVDSKYTINRPDNVLNVVKSELYATVQYNEYTKNIKMNDRFILGSLDFDDKSNNNAYKVKELFKFGAIHPDNPNSVPLMVIAFDRDIVNPELDLISKDNDGIIHYIADYYIKKEDKDNNKDPYTYGYYMKISPDVKTIYQGESQKYSCTLCDHSGNTVTTPVTFTTSLLGTTSPSSYYNTVISGNDITVSNLKRYYKNDLLLQCTVNSSYNVEPLKYSITLGEKL